MRLNPNTEIKRKNDMVGLIVCLVLLFILLAVGIWSLIYQRKVMEELRDETKKNLEEINKDTNTLP